MVRKKALSTPPSIGKTIATPTVLTALQKKKKEKITV